MALTKEIDLDTTVTQATGLVSADLDGEKVMLSIEKGKYYGLNSIGSRIWELLEKPLTVREMVEVLLEEYDVEESTCLQDVQAFIRKLHTQLLVKID